MASNDQTIPFPASPAGPSSTAGFAPAGGGYGTEDGSAATSVSTTRQDSASGTGAAGAAGASDDLMGKVVQGAHQTIDRLAEKAAPHVQRLQEGASGAGDKLGQGLEQARAVRDEWAESLRCTVRENPLAAVAAALAIGMLVARVSR